MIATGVALCAVLAAIVGVQRRLRGNTAPALDGNRVYARVVLAGVVLANAIPHFVHGITGVDFPAPFARQLGPGTANYVLNVVWAVFNAAAGANLARTFWNRPSRRAFRAAFAAGFVAMLAFLAIVFR